jgi:IS66 C-terminal element
LRAGPSIHTTGVAPHAYLQYVIERIAGHPINPIEEPLPWNVAEHLNLACAGEAREKVA